MDKYFEMRAFQKLSFRMLAREIMIPKWQFWIWPTLLASPWIVFLVMHTINPPPPSEDWRLLLVFLILGTYALFLVPYWTVVSVRNRQWGLLVPLALVNFFWIIRAGVDLLESADPRGVGGYALFGITASYMLASSLIIGIAYGLITSLTKRFRVRLRRP